MTKALVHIAVISFLTINTVVYAQNNSVDGIVMGPSSVNEKTFHFGEPAHIYFKITNIKNGTNYYHKPVRFMNASIVLRNLSTGKIMKERNIITGHGISAQTQLWKKQAPSEQEAYKANETIHYDLFLNDEFGTEKLSAGNYASSLNDKLRSLPPGEYEITMDYALLPGNKKLTTSYRFNVTAVPPDEKEAFDRYVRSTEYAAKNHFKAERNYSKGHPASYENFLKDYPNSIFANHAFISMADQIYGYADPSNPDQKDVFNRYLAYYSNLRNDGIKMEFVKYIPEFVGILHKTNSRSELDQYLKKMEYQNWELSNRLIRFSQSNLSVEGLVNYAEQHHDRR